MRGFSLSNNKNVIILIWKLCISLLINNPLMKGDVNIVVTVSCDGSISPWNRLLLLKGAGRTYRTSSPAQTRMFIPNVSHMLKIWIEGLTSGWYIVLNLNMGQTCRPKGSCLYNWVIFVHSNSVTFNKVSSAWCTYYFYFTCEAL
jgi:hypothetical protein